MLNLGWKPYAIRLRTLRFGSAPSALNFLNDKKAVKQRSTVLDYKSAMLVTIGFEWISLSTTRVLRRKVEEIFQYVVLKWTLAFLIQIDTGLVGFFNRFALENIAGFKPLLSNNLMLEDK
ncbi:hypothetical protein L1049_020689 [Liquidambar formosana]|uniref:Uncharacterized protein n=1 Tax=Liquidambar formosana TaxID=63359 RepID=A0AAP0S8B8_LIQFO